MTLKDVKMLDGVDADGYVGKIIKGGQVVGRIDMGSDGKAMVFVGESGDQRVQYEGRDAWYSEDDAPLMIDWLLASQEAPAIDYQAKAAELLKGLSNDEKELLGYGMGVMNDQIRAAEDSGYDLNKLTAEMAKLASQKPAGYPEAPEGWTRTVSAGGEFVKYDNGAGVTVSYNTGKSHDRYSYSIKGAPDGSKTNGFAPWQGYAGTTPGYVTWERIFNEANAVAKRVEINQAAPFEHSGFKIMPRQISIDGTVKTMWGVQSIENREREQRGERQIGGDGLFDTKEQAMAAAERQVKDAEAEAQWNAKQEAKAQEEAAKRESYLSMYADFIAAKGYTPAIAERVRKALQKKYARNGSVVALGDLIESEVADGAKIGERKGKRTLEDKEGGFLEEGRITKIGIDYAEYLIAKRRTAGAAADKDPSRIWISGQGLRNLAESRGIAVSDVDDEDDVLRATIEKSGMRASLESRFARSWRIEEIGEKYGSGFEFSAEVLSTALDEFVKAAEAKKSPVPESANQTAESEAANEAKTFLKSVIDGTADMMDLGLADRLTAIHDQFSGDSEMLAMFNDAAKAYSSWMIDAAKRAMS